MHSIQRWLWSRVTQIENSIVKSNVYLCAYRRAVITGQSTREKRNDETSTSWQRKRSKQRHARRKTTTQQLLRTSKRTHQTTTRRRSTRTHAQQRARFVTRISTRWKTSTSNRRTRNSQKCRRATFALITRIAHTQRRVTKANAIAQNVAIALKNSFAKWMTTHNKWSTRRYARKHTFDKWNDDINHKMKWE